MKRANVTHLNYTRGKHQESASILYESLFHHVIDGILMVNSGGRIEYMNPAYEEMFGVSNFALAGKSVYQIPNDEIILTALKNKKTVQGELKLPYGHRKISVTASPLMEDAQWKGIIAIYREETLEERSPIPIPSCQTSQEPLPAPFQMIIGESRRLREALRIASRAAKTQATVLITGDSGSGKELVAKAIHESGKQANRPFVKVNCGAIPANLLESELFGHEQGAFTGAIKRKIGKFEQANGGTIFLDEIGDMPMDMQVKLLRVLQEKEFERVGGNETIRCDLRIIAATHRNLEALIQDNLFREDLYYRLNVVPVALPPLRERREDIPSLCQHFMEKIQRKSGGEVKVLQPEVIEAFRKYHWPGNIRELENLMERLMVLVEGPEITLEDLPPYISHRYETHYEGREDYSLVNLSINGELATMDEYEREIIRKALEKFGSFNRAAKALGLTHKTVAYKARKYKIIES